MNRQMKDNYFRRETAMKIADIEDRHCAPCEFRGKSDHFNAMEHCKTCKHGKEIQRLGDFLSQKTIEYRFKKEGRSIPEKLTKEKYLERSVSGATDKEIIKEFGMPLGRFRHLKDKWGLVEKRKKKVTE